MKFDYIIGNPPYGKCIVNKKHFCYDKIGSSKLATHGFIYKSISLLKEGAELSFIIPTNFLCLKSGEKIRQFMHEHGKIISVEIFEDNPFIGYSMPGNVCIIRYIKDTKYSIKTHIVRHLYNKTFSTSIDVKDIIPMSFGDESYSILQKVMKYCLNNDVNLVSVNKIPLSDIETPTHKFKTLVRMNGGSKFVYKWSDKSVDYQNKKVVFSHMLNLQCLLRVKYIRTVVMSNINVSGGLSYIKCENEDIMTKWLGSKIFFICILQLLDNIHMSDTNIGKLITDFKNVDFDKLLGLTHKEISFVKNFSV